MLFSQLPVKRLWLIMRKSCLHHFRAFLSILMASLVTPSLRSSHGVLSFVVWRYVIFSFRSTIRPRTFSIGSIALYLPFWMFTSEVNGSHPFVFRDIRLGTESSWLFKHLPVFSSPSTTVFSYVHEFTILASTRVEPHFICTINVENSITPWT